ncbi:DUF3265 domain-containing protein [Vibrio parahaemolyticus]|nr:DUF3265 domain-containing protein [Vibrio parahaemolyticus]QLE29046.1 DUF3265 domain-containing protein [Vibrio parahaemolyticus]HCE1882491.1 DUF3265 domain-containing protein [Vibrio parahaemolyticus]HCE3647688.1 DUF3265 domain-containing protein [Vibrio parahaemolyticus]HCE4537566.1 DUF3265 domain-containing protein [Vibrio parahaemolyticus]
MTKRSRWIHAAWHFWYAVSFSGESGLRKVGLGGIHPLTQRYVLGGHVGISKGQGNFWRFSETYCKAV